MTEPTAPTTTGELLALVTQSDDGIEKVAAALIKAQAEFAPAVATEENPYFSSKYVDLSGVLAAIGKALRDNDIAVVQQTQVDSNGKLLLFSRLVHSSGQWLGSLYPVNPVKGDPQAMGSALTYARRYALMALVGIAPEDDDGNAASSREDQARQNRSREEHAAPPPSAADVDAAEAAFTGYKSRLEAADTPEALAALGSEIASDRSLPRPRSAALKALFDERMKELTAKPEPEPAANGRSRK